MDYDIKLHNTRCVQLYRRIFLPHKELSEYIDELPYLNKKIKDYEYGLRDKIFIFCHHLHMDMIFQEKEEEDRLKKEAILKASLLERYGEYRAALYPIYSNGTPYLSEFGYRFTRINSDKIIGFCKNSEKTALKMIKFLKVHGVIEVDNSYIPGSKPKGYRFTKRFTQMSDWHLSPNPFEWYDFEPVYNINGKIISLAYASFDMEKVRIIEKELNLTGFSLIWYLHNSERFYSIAEDFYKKTVTGRLICKYNMIKSELRQAILIHGKKTIEPDMKTSHPLLLTSLYTFTDKKTQDEKARYFDFIRNQDLYSVLTEYCGISDRKTFKESYFYTWLFGTCYDYDIGINRFFKENFPILFKIIRKINRKHGNLARKLQYLEAKTLIYPLLHKFDIVPIHDGFRCLPEDLPAIKEVIVESYKSIGIDLDIEKQLVIKS